MQRIINGMYPLDETPVVEADETNKNLIHYVADYSKGFAAGYS